MKTETERGKRTKIKLIEVQKLKLKKREDEKESTPLSLNRGKLLQIGAQFSSSPMLLFHHPRSMIETKGIQKLKNLSKNLFFSQKKENNNPEECHHPFKHCNGKYRSILSKLKKQKQGKEQEKGKEEHEEKRQEKYEEKDIHYNNQIFIWGAFTHRFLSSSHLSLSPNLSSFPPLSFQKTKTNGEKDKDEDKEQAWQEEEEETFRNFNFPVSKNYLLHFTSWWSNHIRGDLLGVYYLDHCLFISRDLYDHLPSGGFPALPIFEDTEFCKAIHAVYQNQKYRYNNDNTNNYSDDNNKMMKKNNDNSIATWNKQMATSIAFPTITLLPRLRFQDSISFTSDIRFMTNGVLKQSFLNQILKIKYWFWSISQFQSEFKMKKKEKQATFSFSKMNRMYDRGLNLNLDTSQFV